MFSRFDAVRFRVVPVLAAVAVLAQLALTAQEPPLPLARDIVSRYVEAIGGPAVHKAIKSMRVKGRFEITGQNYSGDLVLLWARPAKRLTRVTIAGIGNIESGYDGTHGWLIEPLSGPALLKGRQLTELADEAWFDSLLKEPSYVKELTTVARVEFDKRPAYKINFVSAAGTQQTEYYDVETAMLIGVESSRETQLGVVPSTTYLRDYRRFGNQSTATVVVQQLLSLEQVLRVSSVEYDVVPANAFAMPPQVKALVK